MGEFTGESSVKPKTAGLQFIFPPGRSGMGAMELYVMNVGELIKALKEYEQDIPVYIERTREEVKCETCGPETISMEEDIKDVIDLETKILLT